MCNFQKIKPFGHSKVKALLCVCVLRVQFLENFAILSRCATLGTAAGRVEGYAAVVGYYAFCKMLKTLLFLCCCIVHLRCCATTGYPDKVQFQCNKTGFMSKLSFD